MLLSTGHKCPSWFIFFDVELHVDLMGLITCNPGVATSAKRLETDNPSILSLYISYQRTILENLEWSDVVHIEVIHDT